MRFVSKLAFLKHDCRPATIASACRVKVNHLNPPENSAFFSNARIRSLHPDFVDALQE